MSQTIIVESVIATVVAKVIEKPLLQIRSLRVGVNIAQGVQCPQPIGHGKSRAVIALFPKVTRAVQHPVKAHRLIPVEPMHNARHLIRLDRLQQIMDMIAHNTESIEPELKFFLTPPNCEKQ